MERQNYVPLVRMTAVRERELPDGYYSFKESQELMK